MSDIVCFSAGCIGTSLLFALQGVLADISERLAKHKSKYPKLIYEGLVYLIVLGILSALWRGGWNLNLRYIVPDTMIGGWVNHLSGALLFLIFQTYSLVGGCGCGIDGEDAGGEGFFPVQYLRLWFAPKLQRRKVRETRYLFSI